MFAIIIPIAPATAAAINPARAIGPMTIGQLFGGTVHWNQLPVYLIAEAVGAVAGGFLYTALNTRRRAATVAEGPAKPVAAAEGVLS